VDHGTYPFVTSSNPTAGGASAGTGIGPRHLTRIVGIAKAYTTRVGSGPFPTESTDSTGDTLVELGREFGTVTGRRRRTGWLDCVMLRQAARLNTLTELALTKLDVLDTFDSIKVCVGYAIEGKTLHGYPDRLELLSRVEPQYVEMAGWNTVLAGCSDVRELPEEARSFIALVEEQVGTPVKYVGVGPDREQVVQVHP
jgi:adenylosuccinate synthase